MSSTRRFEFFDESQTATMDREFRTVLAQVSAGASPIELGLAMLDWIAHLSISPGKRVQLDHSFLGKLSDMGVYGVESLFRESTEGPASGIERRMSGEARQNWPFKVFA
jgi:polyhydroxyalkanoate synthase